MAHMSEFWITTTDARRAGHWQRLFGSERLPVLHGRARWQWVDGREVPAYDLDLSRLHTGQRDRLAGYVARRMGRPYGLVKMEIDNALSWPVTAAGCELVTEEETAERTRPSLFMSILRHNRWRGNGLRVAKQHNHLVRT